MAIGDIIRQRRKELKITQKSFAQKLGISPSTLYKYETGQITKLSQETLQSIAELLGVPVSYLLGESNIEPVLEDEFIKIPVYGRVPAGYPSEAVEDIVEHIYIPEEYTAGGKELIGLRVKGDSMYPKYQEGDIVVIELTPDAESGEDVVAFVKDDFTECNATLKTLKKMEDGTVILKPYNDAYPEMVYRKGIEILGVVVEYRRRVR